ncbi:DHA2 family efflux MFS transporter permease subunit [Staphylococcus simiae]|uniref:DHA2 family efflux MFS transporter permease subunit n=1 Tax=Staphylococcus simiae TaxID=308354 RepID=UPI001A96B9E8|nr:DHA2 family efflux MFS transporter permease subunit [Staphylococcus simiae]MBO1199059.1 DHA2 family efflux MFS transporter permease subunit [Staphylococcus simiae]MBO1201327.1 DHA2 family efflux MFS transporter permease subunit [Staphylococcus simiae]MBO1203429.1 DHA2 family efflux MFS transporter permease subunit [Staphylococcus simiae]MBO1210957.1 DHA2 family efflux MFS transporter permease subunit [Staphylococcus simiae]MBO1229665.1 DHA2 family efflux MFS transporter permease subunit [St
MTNDLTNHQQASQRMNVIAIVVIGAFLGVLNQTILATILPKVMVDFDVTSSTAQWLTTVFMLVNGIMIPISAFLIEKYTMRKLFFAAVGFLIFGSLLCLLGFNFEMVLLGRAIQAMGAGILMPLTQTILFILFPPEKRGMAMGMFGLVIGFAPAIGPTLAGWFVNIFDWRQLFTIVLIIAVIDFIYGYIALRNMTTQSYPKLDMLSVVLSTVGFGALLYGFSSVGNLGWSHPAIYLTLIVAIISICTFVLRQFKLESPLLEFRVFKYQQFSVSMVIVSLMFMLFIGNLTILPIFMQTMMHWTPLESGLILLPGGLVMGLLSPVTGQLYDKVGGRWLSFIGMLTITAGALCLAQISSDSSRLYVVIAFSITMLGNAMIMTPMTTQALNALPRTLIAHGTAMNNTVRQLSAAIGTGLLVTLMTTLGAKSHVGGIQGAIQGLDLTFYVTAIIALIGSLLALLIQPNNN